MCDINGSLVVVGSGIKCISHFTTEAIAHIKQAEKVLYSVNEPLTAKWIRENGKAAESLDEVIKPRPLRHDFYNEMSNYIFDIVTLHNNVCVVLYGHPTVFSKPALMAAKKLKSSGHNVRILPGISAQDCLFTDLCIDPGTDGCLSYEATDFLLRKRPVISTCHLILWQAGIIGAFGEIYNHDNNSGISELAHYLQNFYPLDHEIIIYEASLYPHIEPTLQVNELKKLPQNKLSTLSTLYIPPING